MFANRKPTRSDGLKPVLVFVVLIAAVNLVWCLTPSNDNPFALLSIAISILTLGLVPGAWRVNASALGWLVVVHVFVGVLNTYRFWSEAHDRGLRIVIAVPFIIAWSLWTIRRDALQRTMTTDGV